MKQNLINLFDSIMWVFTKRNSSNNLSADLTQLFLK